MGTALLSVGAPSPQTAHVNAQVDCTVVPRAIKTRCPRCGASDAREARREAFWGKIMQAFYRATLRCQWLPLFHRETTKPPTLPVPPGG
jgi:hypothetical protein